MSKKKNVLMGVLNVTPDSFSDGGFYETDQDIFQKINFFKNSGVHVIDVGAESTAPFNEGISSDEEKKRLLNFIRVYRDLKCDLKVSLDSYKIDTVNWFFKELKSEAGIWNDVSGQLDDDVKRFLEDHPHYQYVWCHNNVPKRSLTTHHMDYVNDDNIFDQFKRFFEKDILKQYKSRLILDPCFGFSKSYEQNWEIIDNWQQWNELYSNYPVVFGISKKSFLRKKLSELTGLEYKKPDALKYSEFLHSRVLSTIVTMNDQTTYFRLHDPILGKITLSHFNV